MRGHAMPPRVATAKAAAGRKKRPESGPRDCDDSKSHLESSSVQNSAESIESEISNLTWAVLDGCATSEQRKRLAELVSQQHERRESPK